MKINTPEPVQTNLPPRGQTFSRGAPAYRETSGIHLKNILVPVDFSERSLRALEYAEPLARLFGATITLLHVIEPPTYPPEMMSQGLIEQESQSAATGRLHAVRAADLKPDVSVEMVVRYGFVFESIIETARETKADLIVTTTHGYTGLQHMLAGSVAECVLRHAPCPVLVVRECEHDAV